MAVTAELNAPSRTVEELRAVPDRVHARHGDSAASRPDDLTPLATVPNSAPDEVHVTDDTPPDPALWADADDEGLGGYQR